VGLAATLVAAGMFLHAQAQGTFSPTLTAELVAGAFIGAITFTGSIIAFGKLQGLFGASPIVFRGQHLLNLLLFVVMLATGIYSGMQGDFTLFVVMCVLACVLGITLIIPIGGADMPVVVSMLNSYSGWAAAATGFTLGNVLLIMTGALVGASGAILSYIMCKAMNRSFISVILGGF